VPTCEAIVEAFFTVAETLQAFMNQLEMRRAVWRLDGAETIDHGDLEESMELLNGCASDAQVQNSFALVHGRGTSAEVVAKFRV